MEYNQPMAESFFNKVAWYLTTYTDSLSIQEWKTVTEDVFKTFVSGTSTTKRMSMKDAQRKILHMTKYWCVEQGSNYRGEMAAYKFKKCYRWNDYYDSRNDQEQRVFVDSRFDELVQTKKATDAWVVALNKLPTVDVSEVWVDPRTREGMRVLVDGARNRYGEESKKFDDTYAKIACTLTSRPIIIASQGWNWYRRFGTLRTEGPFIAELVYQHGDGLKNMKLDMMKGGERS